MIEYQTCMALPQTVGQRVGIEGTDWICVKDSTFIGWTIESLEPVLLGPDGPVLYDGQYVKASHFKTFPKPGQTHTEIMTLAEYERINPCDLVGKNITHVNLDYNVFVAICDDKTYVKLKPGYEQYDGDLELYNNDLSIHDLKQLDILSNDEWATHQAEFKARRIQDNARLYDQQFKAAMNQIGKDRAKELMGDSR